MDKLKMHSLNKVDANIAKIGALFPNCLTERKNSDGEVEYAIDFDMLKQELSSVIVEGAEERYQFTWPDKRKSILLANAPIAKTLRPCRAESVDFDTTENLYIEGDNLDVLKLLQETYLGKIKMIYIDPPYNTGNDFVYNDDFAEDADTYLANSGQFDAEGNRLVQNTESNGRFHTDWLNMMYPRLKLAKSLLADDGTLFISIDDHESSNLRKLCNEVFGEECFAADISWQRTYSPRNDSKGVASEVEHLLVYSKNNSWMPHPLPRTAEMDARYKSPDQDPVPWKSGDALAAGAADHQGMVYGIQHPQTGKILYPAPGNHWRLGQSDILKLLSEWAPYKLADLNDSAERARVCNLAPDDVRKGVLGIVLSVPLHVAQKQAKERYSSGNWPMLYFTSGGLGGLARKVHLKEDSGRIVTNFWPHAEAGHTDEEKKELKTLFSNSIRHFT